VQERKSMQTQEEVLKKQYAELLASFAEAFPQIAAPAGEWWGLWLRKYSVRDIQHAIATLQKHPLRGRFTTESTGKAITALLRENALRRVVNSGVKP
jgi:hypothetical protein